MANTRTQLITWASAIALVALVAVSCYTALQSRERIAPVQVFRATHTTASPAPAKLTGAAPPQNAGHEHPAPPPKDASSGPVLGAPPVEFNPTVIDLGTVRPNEKLSGQVFVHNLSANWLKILSAKADCTCTSVNLEQNSIAPGASVAIEVEYRSNSVMGEKKGEVRVLIDGYDMVALPVKAYVTMPVRAEPPYISALKNETGQVPTSGEFDVLSNDQKAFTILAVDGKPPQYLNFDPKTDSPRNIYRLKWDFSGYDPATCRDKEGNRLPGWIAIETDHPNCPIFDIEVRHECNRRHIERTDTWIVQEKRVLVGAMKAGEPSELEVVTKWLPRAVSDDVPKTAVSESPDFTVDLTSVNRIEDGAICRLRVTPKAEHKGLLYGNVRLYSNQQSSAFTVIGTVR